MAAPARKPAPAPEPAPSRFRIETSAPVRVRRNGTSTGPVLDQELLGAMEDSYTTKTWLSVAITDTPMGTRDKKATRDIVTAEAFLRRHATSLGYGLTVTAMDGDRIGFLAQKRKVVKTGAERKPRTPKPAAN